MKERNGFDNLILLCNPHHEEVDGPDSAQYPVEVLLGWKHAREADGVDALAGLGELTKSELGEMIATAQNEVVDRIGPALDEFAKTAPELASLLKVVVKELADPRVHGFGISEDGITMLHSSARTFANLEDSANLLANAADTRRHAREPPGQRLRPQASREQGPEGRRIPGEPPGQREGPFRSRGGSPQGHQRTEPHALLSTGIAVRTRRRRTAPSI